MEEIIRQFVALLKLDSLDESKELEFVERKTGIKPSGFVLATLVFLLIVTFISNATSLVVGIGCCLVPAYFTFLVLESNNRKLLKKYLIYWIFYALIELFSPLLSYLLPSMIYIILRIAVALAVLHPESLAAEKFFSGVVQPFVLQYENDIDKNIDIAYEKGQ
jgi:receptor expression-enhancing protein 5/6